MGGASSGLLLLVSAVGQVISFMGLALAGWSFLDLVAWPPDAPINRSGSFALMRHPMYAGFLLRALGLCLAYPISWRPLGGAALWLFLYWRTGIEEDYLSENVTEWKAYCEETPSWFIPKLIL